MLQRQQNQLPKQLIMQNSRLRYLLCGCILFLTACSKQDSASVFSGAENKGLDDKSLHTRLGQPKHFDIPLPLTFSLKAQASRQQEGSFGDHLVYSGAHGIPDVIAFYKREMERNGWNISDLSSQQEGFLYCSKPTKSCGITIRRDHSSHHKNNKTTLSVFVTETA